MGKDDTSDLTTEQVVPNPTGKGGFGDNPQNRNPGGWKKENTISYQYHRFMNMTPDELREWSKTPNSERTVAMDLAYNRVLEARKSLQDVKEITDRTEGKPAQTIKQNININPVDKILEGFGLNAGQTESTEETTSSDNS